MALTDHERPSLNSDWPFLAFPKILDTQVINWPDLNGLGYPDLNGLADTDETESMRIEELREGDELVIKAEVPGVDPENDIEITVYDGNLDIHVERKEQYESSENGVYRSEFRYGEFNRRIPVPASSTSKDLTANYRDGILEIRVPVPSVDPQKMRVPVTRS